MPNHDLSALMMAGGTGVAGDSNLAYFEREDGEVLTNTNSSLYALARDGQFDLNTRQFIAA